ncbi:hypothetical protein [Rufibacter latericius]|uniref:Uncharacterized protein n=1 Tax=Rufibacter latericius TaxID=2487040 RepID=A0A3M9MM22_9BACT|nr:hypothetical protein [Rufibacter latericius]RNI26592.1 hypothetical protein EFB08_11275 [Rufibacter latericius]
MSETTYAQKYAQLAQAVKSMRDAQKQYFKYRERVDLEASKKREKLVDELLEESIPATQTSLF